MPTVADVIQHLETLAPPALAADWDNVGLLLGERDAAVIRLMTCLTVTPESAAEAIETGAQFIVTHHPILFRAIKRLTDASAEGRMLIALARAGIAVYSPHTAFDNARDGINDMLCQTLGLIDVKPLRRRDAVGAFKIVTFVPEKDLQKVSNALFSAGAGASDNTANAASAWQALVRSLVLKPATPPSARKGSARKQPNGDLRRSARRATSMAWS